MIIKPEPLATPQPPSWQLLGYTIEEFLGAGASGQVWAVRSDETGKRAALKWLPSDASMQDRERLRREAALLAAFHHPHVIRLQAVLSTSDGLALMLDLAEGGSLVSLLAERQRLSPGEVVTLVKQAGTALIAGHQAGLTHGDISPGNILFGANASVLLADFGMARLIGDRAHPTHGTWDYLAPEIRAGAAIDPAADVYALAAVAAKALTGQLLASDFDTSQHWAQHAVDLGLPVSLVQAISVGMVPQPEARPNAGQFVSSICQSCLAAPILLTSDTNNSGVYDVNSQSINDASNPITRRIPRPAPAVIPQKQTSALLRTLSVVKHNSTAFIAKVNRSRLPFGSANRWTVLTSVILVLVLGVGYVWLHWQNNPKPIIQKPTVEANTYSDRAAKRQLWEKRLNILDKARSDAFVALDVEKLTEVYLTDSQALRADAQQLELLERERLIATELRHNMRVTRVEKTGDQQVILKVRDQILRHQIRSVTGEVLRTVPAKPVRTVLIKLQRSSDGNSWLIAEIRRH